MASICNIAGLTLMGLIKLIVPNTNKILNMLLPTMFPIAISPCFFQAAIPDVANSGKEVPKAAITKPIKESLKPAITDNSEA